MFTDFVLNSMITNLHPQTKPNQEKFIQTVSDILDNFRFTIMINNSDDVEEKQTVIPTFYVTL